MKTNTTLQSAAFLFNPEFSIAGNWPTIRRRHPRTASRALPFGAETEISYKQELICGVILILCLLFGLAAFVAQFALA